jgi:hypothetical protein
MGRVESRTVGRGNNRFARADARHRVRTMTGGGHRRNRLASDQPEAAPGLNTRLFRVANTRTSRCPAPPVAVLGAFRAGSRLTLAAVNPGGGRPPLHPPTVAAAPTGASKATKAGHPAVTETTACRSPPPAIRPRHPAHARRAVEAQQAASLRTSATRRSEPEISSARVDEREATSHMPRQRLVERGAGRHPGVASVRSVPSTCWRSPRAGGRCADVSAANLESLPIRDRRG